MNFFDVKINSVLHGEILTELGEFLDYFKDKKTILRFIERMPFSSTDAVNVTGDDLLRELEKMGCIERISKEDTKVARMYNYKYKHKHDMRIGIIPPVSHSFCSKCNRLRLTCDGFLRTCLLSNNEYDLKTQYRMDMGDENIERIILRAAAEKPKEHNLCCDKTGDSCTSLISNRSMSKIGG